MSDIEQRVNDIEKSISSILEELKAIPLTKSGGKLNQLTRQVEDIIRLSSDMNNRINALIGKTNKTEVSGEDLKLLQWERNFHFEITKAVIDKIKKLKPDHKITFNLSNPEDLKEAICKEIESMATAK